MRRFKLVGQENTAAQTFLEVGAETVQHLDQIFTGFQIKMALAGVSSLFVSVLGGDWYVFELWFAMNVVDLICGIALAVRGNCFSRRRVYGWVVKTFTHILTIILVGLVSFTFSYLARYSIPVLDWFMFVLLLTETASVFDSLIKLGLPIPPLARKLVVRIRRKTEANLAEIIDNKQPQEENQDEKKTDV